MAENKEEITISKSSKSGFYYSFLTLVLLFCLIQIGFGAILNISKTISYRGKISVLSKIRDHAEAQNHDLKQDIKLFSSTQSLEGIARNNLKMAREDEVLVLINNNQPQSTSKKKFKRKHKK
jgi:cell division protein FtsB